ncbi:MAG: hypothetical protein ABIJ65_11785 [Chloroflexota bacterium]
MKQILMITIVLMLVACSPSESAIQTAIAQTKVAMPTPTQIPTQTPVIIVQPVGGFGRYYLNSSGTVVRVDIPAQPSDMDVNEIETLRVKLNLPEASYIIVDIDNIQGQSTYNLGKILVVTEDSEQIEYQPAGNALGEWLDALSNSADIDTYNECVSLANSFINKQKALSGEVTRLVFIAPQALSSVLYVFADEERMSRTK